MCMLVPYHSERLGVAGYRDGSTPPIAKISSMPSDSVFYSSDQYMDIIFHSDDSDSFPGFWLTYEAVDTESEASGQ